MHLLDVNTLIALAWDDHEHYDAAHAWFSANAIAGFATCHVTQSGFLRVSLTPNPKFRGISCEGAIRKHNSFTSHPNHHFWNDGPVQTNHSIWSFVTGHKQVTDTNLFLIARQNQGKLVTFDGAIRNRVQGTEREWVKVIVA